MSQTPATKQPLSAIIKENWSDRTGMGGSKSSYVACYAANQVLGTVWRGDNEDADTKEIRETATLRRLSDIGAHDVIEAMLGAQMVATHEAAMEAFRRAALAEQTFAGRELGLKYGDRLVRSFAALTDALNRHRGKGQQVVRVEHVTVQAGGQAIVGAVTQGGGNPNGNEDRPHAQQPLPMHQSPRCGARTRSGSPCRSPAVKGRRRCRMHGGATGSGAPAGNRNALKHGRYSREVLEFRHAMRELLRENAEKLELV